MDRRKFIQNIAPGVTLLSVKPHAVFCNEQDTCSAQFKNNQHNYNLDIPQVQIGDDIAIADTEYGKVKGYVMRGIYTFLGIPYAADTSGKNRFMPPHKRESWAGIRPAVFYANSSPQDVYSRASTSYDMFVDHWNYDELSEDCLALNIWTPSLSDDKKRPVIVWLHGGGFSRGNGIEQDGYNGENITRYGDVVYCSINHRLNVFGFSDLSGVGGEKYRDSGNVGLLDIVAALQWIHDNIANFGGDPGNVTIIGQSGGGAKVCMLATMPAVKHLAHKAVSLSGSATSANNQDYSRELGRYILKEANLSPRNIDRLQDMPWADYLKIAQQAYSRMEKEKGPLGMPRCGFAPVADNVHLPAGEFFQDRNAPDVPIIFCTTFHEWNPGRTDSALEQISLSGVAERIKQRYGDRSDVIVEAYARNFPEAKPVEILNLINSNRLSVVEAAKLKLAQNSPVYMAWFGWCPPLFDGRMRAFHCLDISFWFLNTDLMLTHTGGGVRPRALSYRMADALLNFARTGNPNCISLPMWPRYTEQNGETMILNDNCEVKNDPDRAARSTLMP
ncbi:MAG: carboxylesterase family protein [Parabacteroides sp.]|jgi:para-nitrobenzyl esterase|nr:carboxylesterase family protein [Parabacteroides sp.]